MSELKDIDPESGDVRPLEKRESKFEKLRQKITPGKYKIETGSKGESRTSPEDTSLDTDAEHLLIVAARIGEKGSSGDYRSFTTILLSLLVCGDRISRWFRRELEARQLDYNLLLKKVGLNLDDVRSIAETAQSSPESDKKRPWTASAIGWLERAKALAKARTRDGSAVAVTPRDIVGALLYFPNFHERDKRKFKLDTLDLSNAFLNYILMFHAPEYQNWANEHKRIHGVEAKPDVFAGPAAKIASDRWTVDDRLRYRIYARAFKNFLLNGDTEAPLSISVQAPWGAGKTSLMRMIQQELDPEAVDAAKQGGWHAFKARKTGDAAAKKLSVADALRTLEGSRKTSGGFQDDRAVYTVWFNAWKYESDQQLWSGLATTLLEDLTARMTSLEREKFLLRLQLSRIAPDSIRRSIYNWAFQRWLEGMRKLWIWFVNASPLAAGGTLAAALQNSHWLISGGIGSALFIIASAFIRFGQAQAEAKSEPVSTVLGDLVSVPDYAAELGFTHHAIEDLSRLFSSLPLSVDKVVVFIDDLDRCSPNKVAQVVEGINMFLAGDSMPCIFVIGMDPQMVSAALEETHKGIVERLPGYDRHTPIGWRFMDKFVQLPFTIPPAERDSIEEYARSLVSESHEKKALEETLLQVAPLADKSDAPEEVHGEIEQLSRSNALNSDVAQEFERLALIDLKLRRQDEFSERFRDSHPDVRDMLLAATESYSPNPRDIKRLLNVLRLQYLLSRGRIAFEEPIPTNDQIARWVVLALKWPSFVRWLHWSPTRHHFGEAHSVTGTDVRRRLELLEQIADATREQRSSWKIGIMHNLELAEDDVDWISDVGLHTFFVKEAERAKGERLSNGAALGIY